MKRRGFLALLAAVPVVGRFLDAAPAAAAPLAVIPEAAASPPTETRRATAYVTYADDAGRVYRKAIDSNVSGQVAEIEVPRGVRLLDVHMDSFSLLPVMFRVRTVDVDLMHFAVGAGRAMHWVALS